MLAIRVNQFTVNGIRIIYIAFFACLGHQDKLWYTSNSSVDSV